MPIKLYSNPTSQKPDKATLHKFKRIAALRQDLERCDAFQILHHPRRHANKLIREGIKEEPIYRSASSAAWEFAELKRQYIEIVTDMCEKVNEEKLKEMASKLPDSPSAREYSKQRVLYQELVPTVSRFEALLEADAAQERPVLNSRDRGAIRDVLREHLKTQGRYGRIRLTLIFAMVSLAVWGYYSLPTQWRLGSHERSSSERTGDFSELHTRDEDVE